MPSSAKNRFRSWALLVIACALLPTVACTQQTTPPDPEPTKAAVPTSQSPDTGAHHAEVEYMSTDFAMVFHQQKQAMFIDVRGDHAFAVEHIEGALSYGLPDVKTGKIPDLPRDTMLVVYCGCPHSMSTQAALIFRKHGYTNLYVLDEGYYDWKEKGYPITSNAEKVGTLRRMTIRGTAPGVAERVPVYATHKPTGQLEIAEVQSDGSFELHLPFYDVADGEPIVVTVMKRERIVGFSESEATLDLVAAP